MGEPKLQNKPYEISKWTVWEAYRKVTANKGAPGVDEQSLAGFEADLQGTCTRSGIGCPRAPTFLLRFGR